MHKDTKSLLKCPEVSPLNSLSKDFPYTVKGKNPQPLRYAPELWTVIINT